ncbi:MAG: enoyl-CoA hydratase [Anaerolineales bacterium]|nr:enoyl-CoA hydratase [Anaerolineales bacterium]
MDPIHYSTYPQGVSVLTINRPKVRNALNWEAMEAFSNQIESVQKDPELQTLIVTGAEGTFCAGGDLKELMDYPSFDDGVRLSSTMGDALKKLEELPCPTIAAIEGHAIGGGAEIALACDMRVMSEEATIGLSHIRLGIGPAWGGGQRLLRLVGYARAIEWLSTGRWLSGIEALKAGLVNRLVERGQALESAIDLATSITRNPPQVVQAIKNFLRVGISQDGCDAESVEYSTFAKLWASPIHHEIAERYFNAIQKRTKKK